MQSNEAKPLLYSPNSAARALDISRTKIYDLMKMGALGWVQIGADRRIRASELERLAAEGTDTKAAA